MQRPDMDPSLVKEQGLFSPPSGIARPPAVRALFLELRTRLHFRLIVSTDVQLVLLPPTWLHAPPAPPAPEVLADISPAVSGV